MTSSVIGGNAALDKAWRTMGSTWRWGWGLLEWRWGIYAV